MAVIPEPNESQGAHVMRSLDLIWAWCLSASYLCSEHRILSQPKPIQLTQYVYKPFKAYSYDINSLVSPDSLPQFFPDVEWSKKQVQEAVTWTGGAKIHAEAALMASKAYIKDKVGSSYLSELLWPNFLHFQSREIPIGVSKRCCQLCWETKELLHVQKPSLNFVLPGTHGTFFAWIPPPEIPNEVLRLL